MILEFRCSNFRSINKEVDFNFLATSDKKFSENLVEFDGHKFLKFSEIIGPNGSGKSTILDAIYVLKQMVCHSYTIDANKSVERPFNPHKLNKDEPTKFKIWFKKGNSKFYYEVSYVMEQIIEENLYYCDLSKSNKMITIFERENNSFIPGSNFKEVFGNCDNELTDKKLLLSVSANITKIKPIQDAFSFFDDDVVIWKWEDSDRWTEEKANELQNNINFDKNALDLLRQICPKLQSITSKVQKQSVYTQDIFGNNNTTLDIKINYDNFSTDISEESLGTRILLIMINTLLDVIKNNKVFLCDDYSNNLHPAIDKELIRFFYSYTESDAQLIITTHNLELLDSSLIRRDQIWFTDIDNDKRETELYSLAEYKGVANDDNLRKGYVENRYGSWPNIEL